MIRRTGVPLGAALVLSSVLSGPAMAASRPVPGAGYGTDGSVRQAVDATGRSGRGRLGADAGAWTWLRGRLQPRESFVPSFAVPYADAYVGGVSGSVRDVADLNAGGPRVAFDEDYPAELAGPERGSASRLPASGIGAYLADVWTTDGHEQLQGTFAVGADGRWTTGELPVPAGRHVVTLRRRADDAVVAINDGTDGTRSGVAVLVYVAGEPDRLQQRVPLHADGTFTSTVSVEAGPKEARVVRLLDGRVLGASGWDRAPLTGAVRSLDVPQHDPLYGVDAARGGRMSFRTEQRSYVYDDALTVIAALEHGDAATAQTMLATLARLQNADGSLFICYDVLSGQPISETVRNGTIAWVGYAATRYDQVSGDRQFRPFMRRIAAFLIGQQVARAGDPALGSIRAGLTKGAVASWVSTEHNVDAYFFLRDLGYLTRDGSFRAAAGRIRESLLQHHWNAAEGRFNQGVGDPSRALDCGTWGGLFLLAVGDRRRADQSAAFVQRFATVQPIATFAAPDSLAPRLAIAPPVAGYRPYLPGGDYRRPPNIVWAEGTWGALLFRLRRGEDITTGLQAMRLLQSSGGGDAFLQTTDGVSREPYGFHAWSSVAGTAWADIVTTNPGFVFQPDGWNAASRAVPRPA